MSPNGEETALAVMNRTEAATRLTELGFSAYDAQKMVTTNALDRRVGGQVTSGLTGTAEVKVFYKSDRYRIEQWSRGEGPAPCMWPREGRYRIRTTTTEGNE